jgi:hypothetical protein
MDTITITEYLGRKGMAFQEKGDQLLAQCPFSDCDKDRREADWRFYLNKKTTQYHCKRCSASGNIFDLAKHLGDEIKDIALDSPKSYQKRSVPKKREDLALTDELVETLHKALPERIRAYLNGRGITDPIINGQKLGWGEFYGRNWIVIPITNIEGKYSLLKLRKDPEDTTNQNKMMAYPKGAQHEIYGWEMLRGYAPFLVLCEGEFDRLVLLANGIPAATSTGGCGTFKDEWVKHFAKVEKTYICYDRDDAGNEGTTKVLGKLLELDFENVFRIDLPEMGDGKKDVTDYFVGGHGNVDTFMALARPVTKNEVSDRIKQISRPFKPVTFKEWKEVIMTNFPDLMFPAEICASIVAQILIHEIANPFAVVLIGAPSGGKTICINFFDAIEELTYASDKFTPAAFVSNASNVKREKLAELDLLPRLKNKAFLVRDLATLFSKRDDDLNECLGILTRALDGEGLSTDTGIHGQRNVTGAYLFMMIAASTPIASRVWKMMGSLGSRLFFFDIKSREKAIDELVTQLKSTAFKEKERACRNATKNLLYTLWDKHKEGIVWNRDADPDEVMTVIARCAKLLAKLRGVISVWKEKRNDGGEVEFDYTPPIIENPDRVSILFYNLCRGHATLTGRSQINVDDLKLIVELAIDSAPTTRARLFRELVDHGGKMTTAQVEMRLDCSKPTALKEMKTLEALGVCGITKMQTGRAGEPEYQLQLASDFEWFLSDECRRIRGVAGIPIQDTLSDLLD